MMAEITPSVNQMRKWQFYVIDSVGMEGEIEMLMMMIV